MNTTIWMFREVLSSASRSQSIRCASGLRQLVVEYEEALKRFSDGQAQQCCELLLGADGKAVVAPGYAAELDAAPPEPVVQQFPEMPFDYFNSVLK